MKMAKSALMALFVLCAGKMPMAVAATNDTINGIVSDSLLSAVMDSVNVASEGLSVKTKAGGAFQLVLGSTQIKQSSQITQSPSIAWNPSKCLFSWSGFSSGIVFRVLDLSGRIITRYESPKNVTGGTFSFSGMRSGIYLATINGQGKTDSYRIVNLPGAIGNYDISISHISGNGGSMLAKAAATLKSHVLIFTKPGYKTYTVAVAAGTPSGAPHARIKGHRFNGR